MRVENVVRPTQNRRYSNRARVNHAHGGSAGVGLATSYKAGVRASGCDLSATLRMTTPKRDEIASSCPRRSSASWVTRLRWYVVSDDSTKRAQEPTLRFLRSAMAREWP